MSLTDKEINKLVAEKKVIQVLNSLDYEVQISQSYTERLSVLQKYKQWSTKLDLEEFKVTFLSSVTINPIIQDLELESFRQGIKLETQIAPFNSFELELLDSNSNIHAFNPDLIVVFLRAEELNSDIYDSFTTLPLSAQKESIKEIIDRPIKIIETIRSKFSSKIMVSNFKKPERLAYGINDRGVSNSHLVFFQKLNDLLSDYINLFEDTYLLDIDYISSAVGLDNWESKKMWYNAKAPLSLSAYKITANHIVRLIVSLMGKIKKVIVLDLDNTLWGGVLGEEGLDGISLGEGMKDGGAYVDFQKQLLDYHNNGFVLCLASKNNYSNVKEVFDKHPDMILGEKHFASIKVNWIDKATNIKNMARELNLGLDSFVFIDDNPVERDLIRHQIPEVFVPEIGENPVEYIDILRNIVGFDRLSYTSEDYSRAKMYKAQVERKELRSSVESLEDFFKQLKSIANISIDNRSIVPRLANMTQKTNQFNLTTKRYHENDILGFIESKDYSVYSMSLSDRFGDNGVVGLLIIEKHPEFWEIDTFLLSCRVMGRFAENTLISKVFQDSIKENNWILKGKFLPTDRNAPVKDLYKSLGFTLETKSIDEEAWTIDLTESKIKYPEWIEVNND